MKSHKRTKSNVKPAADGHTGDRSSSKVDFSQVQSAQFKKVKEMEAAAQLKSNKTGMPDQLKSGLENLAGMDMSDVRVHRNSSRPSQVGALAYTQGNDIHLGPGQEKHLPHESWHVVQQRQGRVQPTTSVAGQPVNDDSGLEKEADLMGEKAIQMKPKEEEELD